jgi:hypothetical protein
MTDPSISSNSRFPSELIDSSFSHLLPQDGHGFQHFDEGIATLKRCSMDPFLCRFAERHLYSSIMVRNSAAMDEKELYPGVYYDTTLAKLFSERPHIARYVRHMTIVLADPKSCLEDILSMVSRLESVTLTRDKSGIKLRWDFMPASFRAAFVACIKSPRMKKVVLEHLSQFSLFVLDDCSIGNLILRDVYLVNEGMQFELVNEDPTPSYPVLDSLTLDCVLTFLPCLHFWAKRHIHKLRSLTFSPILSGLSTLSLVLPICSNTLTSLDIDFLSTCTSPSLSESH